MAKPRLEEIAKQMEKGEDFELTGQEYKKKTHLDFPKDQNYAEKKSAVARKAREYGYRIEVIPQRIRFIKDK